MNLTGQMRQLNNMLSAVQNPQGYMTDQMFRQLIRENPDKWNQAQRMFAGKTHKQQVAELKKLYQSKGMDLDAMAKQYGVQL